MPTVLLATASVHTTAAACDHLDARLGEGDRVIALTVAGPTVPERDAGDAANVARTRLAPATVSAVIREGNPAAEILALAREAAVDRIVLGATHGDPGAAGTPPGSTVRAVLAQAPVPVTVVPSPARSEA